MAQRRGLLSAASGMVLAILVQGQTAIAQQAIEALPEEARLEVVEEWGTNVLPEASPRWVYVLDVAFDNLIASRINIYDSDSGRFLGVIHSGFVPNLLLSPDKSELYVDETYYSRGTQGERTDVLSIYDARTLKRTGEVILPEGRALLVSKLPAAALSPDGRFLLSYNMAPATSVSLVDIKARRYLGEIESPGCALVYPTGERTFSMLCPDGSFVDVAYDENGGAEIFQNEPFFDSETDPVFSHGAIDVAAGKGFFVSYEGMLYEIGIADGRTRVADRWSILSEADVAEGWRPGGWQLLDYQPALGRVFVLMHRGPKWSHKWPGEEIWVLDPATNTRVARFPLEEPAISLMLTREADPVLLTLTDTGTLGVLDPASGEPRRKIEGTGFTPFLLHAFAE